ncbi:MAG TPA: hypothetical protein EYG98_06215 [Sulfurovum sp.]|nr:hypothetical protein [Sulfurovum sp.]
MLKKIILSAVIVVGLSTTGAMANNNTNHLIKLASKQETLSKDIIRAYKKQDKGSSVLNLIRSLRSAQTEMKSDIKNPMIGNLLVFLNICLDDLKSIANKPYSSDNARLVVDLSAAILEGHQYIGQSLQKNM